MKPYSKNLIFVSTSTQRATIAIINDKGQWFYTSSYPQNHHQFLGHVLWYGHPSGWSIGNNQNYEFYLDMGPGAFTGLRVGFGYVKTLAFWLKAPIFTCSSLELIWAEANFPEPAVVGLNAYGQKLYVWSTFNPTIRLVSENDWLEECQSLPPKTPILGDIIKIAHLYEKCKKLSLRPQWVLPELLGIFEII